MGTSETVDGGEVFDALVGALGDAGWGVLVADAFTTSTRLHFVSDGACAILARSRAELMGSNGLDLIAPEELPRMERFASESTLDAMPPRRLETVFQRDNGERLPVDIVLDVTLRSDAALVVALFCDTSERQRAFRALEESERRFRLVVESAPEAVWILDERRVLYANPAALQLLGFDSASPPVEPDPRSFLPDDDHPTFEARIQRLLTTRAKLPPQEYRIQRRDGDAVVVEVSSITIDYDGRPAVLSFGRDVTERRRIELRLLQADRLAALGLLAGGMAHSINNPLTFVLLELDHLEHTLSDVLDGATTPELASTQLADAYQGAERIAEVVRRMRAFSRVEERARSAVDIRRVLDSALQLVGHELSHRAHLVKDYAEVPSVNASAAHLEQLFLHLLVSSVRFLSGERPGTVRLSVAQHSEANVDVDLVLDSVVLDRAALDQVFEPFFSSARSDLGMGLPFCHAVVSALGGELIAESDPSSGTLLRVRLPIGSPLSAPPESGQVGPRSLRVLIVENDYAVGRAIAAALAHRHDAVHSARALEARDRLIAGEYFDVVLCAASLPDLDGPTLWHTVSRVRPAQAARFAFMLSAQEAAERVTLVERTRLPVLSKPFKVEDVLALVHRVGDPRGV